MGFLTDLKKASYKKTKKRKGKGVGSGQGKTAGRGHKGSKARSGYSISPIFEGGQTSLAVSLPKRGFNNYEFATNYAIVNIADLEELSEVEITLELLKEKRMVRNISTRLKVLGVGETTRALTIKAHKFSKSAKAKIEKAGGKAEDLALSA